MTRSPGPADFGLGSWAERRARISPGRTALVQPGRTLTYAGLAERVERLAGALTRLGVRPGDRVAYLGVNDVTVFETLFATARCGALFVPLNYRLSGPEIRYMLDDSGASVLVHSPDTDDLVAAAGPLPETVRHVLATHPASCPAGGLDFEAELATAGPAPSTGVRLDDPCLLLYTSGTTGRPKARGAHPREPHLEHRQPARPPRRPGHRQGAVHRAAVPLRRAGPDHAADAVQGRQRGAGREVRARRDPRPDRRSRDHELLRRPHDAGDAVPARGLGPHRPELADVRALRRLAGRRARRPRVARPRREAPPGLRHDRSLAGCLDGHPRRHARAPRRRRCAALLHRRGRPRPGLHARTARRDARRAAGARAARLRRLLEPARGVGRELRRRRVVPHRRRRPRRRGRLGARRRPGQGPDHLRRRERLPRRDRGGRRPARRGRRLRRGRVSPTSAGARPAPPTSSSGPARSWTKRPSAPTSSSTSPATRSRNTCGSPMPCRATPPARSGVSNCAPSPPKPSRSDPHDHRSPARLTAPGAEGRRRRAAAVAPGEAQRPGRRHRPRPRSVLRRAAAGRQGRRARRRRATTSPPGSTCPSSPSATRSRAWSTR